MPKSKLMRVILSAGSALIIAGVIMMGWMRATEDDRRTIEVQMEDGETQSVEFKNLSLVPGEECEYTIKLENSGFGKYDLNLAFVETEEKTLKNFARVKIMAKGEVLCDELLATVFENRDIVLPVDFGEDKNTELRIVYYLPIEVGNEAKNAEAIFELLLTANNE